MLVHATNALRTGMYRYLYYFIFLFVSMLYTTHPQERYGMLKVTYIEE